MDRVWAICEDYIITYVLVFANGKVHFLIFLQWIISRLHLETGFVFLYRLECANL